MTNYSKGRAVEYRFIQYLKKTNDLSIIVRSAGSHGPFDVIEIAPALGLIRLYQVKSGKARMTKEERDAMAAIPNAISYLVSKWEVRKKGRRHWEFHKVE